MAKGQRVSKLSGEQKKELFWKSIASQSLSELRETLTATGIEAHTRNDAGRTSIMEAALTGKNKSLDTLLDWYERRRELRSKGWIDLGDDDSKKTAVMLAAGEGHMECVSSLIRFGAKLGLKDEEGKTAFDIATSRKRTEVAKFIDETLHPVFEEEQVEAGGDGTLTSTQRNKLKKKELLAAEGITLKENNNTASVREDRDKSVSAKWDEVTKLFESFDQLRTLHEVNVTKPDAEEVDPALWTCHWLKLLRLKLSPKKFTEIPGKELANLGELQQLILSGNPALVKLPQELTSLSRLRVLEVEGCNLSSLPESFGQLSSLESLNIANNKIEVLDLHGCNLIGLLNISGNRFKNLDLPFASLTRLAEIRCGRNQIEELPPALGSLPNLSIFEGEENKIKTLPLELLQLKKIKVFKLNGNPLIDPKLAKLVKENKGPKDLFSKLEKVGERSAKISSKKKGGKSKKAESEEEEEDEAEDEEVAAEKETSDLDIDDDDI